MTRVTSHALDTFFGRCPRCPPVLLNFFYFCVWRGFGFLDGQDGQGGDYIFISPVFSVGGTGGTRVLLRCPYNPRGRDPY